MDKHDVGPDGIHPDSDLIRYRTFDDGFEVDLRQPSSVVDALLHVMGKARIARREFRAGTETAAAMEDAAKAHRAACGARWSIEKRSADAAAQEPLRENDDWGIGKMADGSINIMTLAEAREAIAERDREEAVRAYASHRPEAPRGL